MSTDFPQNLLYLCGDYRSISEVCRRLGVNRTQFNKYLTGKIVPSRHSMRRIANFFGIEEYELHLPHANFVALLNTPVRRGSGEHKSFFASSLDTVLALSSRQDLERYAGYYFEYYFAMSAPGRVLRSLIHIGQRDGQFPYVRSERLGVPGKAGRNPHNRYHGLTLFLKDRIFLVDYEVLTGNEITLTSLFPSYADRVTRLSGLKAGVAAREGRDPAATRVLLEYLGPRINRIGVLRQLGYLDPSAVDDSILRRIDNAISLPSLFIAKPTC
jgi:transcriptional regulator with XRE-family HTH domain